MKDKRNYPQGLTPLFYSIELRDLFALHLMPMLYAYMAEHHKYFDEEDLCRVCYIMADKMLVAREETRKVSGSKSCE